VNDTLNKRKNSLVFILWVNDAKLKGQGIKKTNHLVIESPHPSPFSAYTGFFGSRPFSQTNSYLISNKITPIKWIP
jgi:uracil-DNA glycosylase